ncbi:MAG: DNA-3-methyladenine glycosylase I [Alphaproteobacteria bacterium]
MQPFSPIHALAEKRCGGAGALAAQLPEPKSDAQLRAESDDRYLSLMSRRAFRAGLKHSLVDSKWPAFEEVFQGFDPHRVRAMSDEDLERLMGETRIIRHWGKIKAVRDNAAALITTAEENGGFGAWLAGWPVTDIMGLWREMAARFRQMGGNSGPYLLRMAGKDTFLLTDDVVRALVTAEVVARKPSTIDERVAVQAAFNAWAEETARPLCQLSRILALSVG